MGTSGLGRYTLGCCAGIALLAGCSDGGTRLSPSPAGLTTQRTRPSVRYGLLYSFNGGSGDGAYPKAGLLDVDDTLYGTTTEGGANNEGTVFSIEPSGKETVLYSFKGSPDDGQGPYATLIKVKDTLYGTTYYGGADDYGTVFSITRSGTETMLHSFVGDVGDGTGPDASLLNVKGALYGTTSGGGANEYGTVFSIMPSGKETVLYSFGTRSEDGAYPTAGLINVEGVLYSTTMEGGSIGDGTVFSITTCGAETVLYSFGGSNGAGGTSPYAGLVNVKGTLYGTTSGGGDYGYGTVFSITPSGKQAVLHSFGAPSSGDGAYPTAGLINVKGALYSTTFVGGANNLGTVFKIATSGAETVLHSFSGGSGDGEYPDAGVLNVKGKLYGTTASGGNYGYGTVFSLKP